MQAELKTYDARNSAATGYQWAESRFARARNPEAGKPLCNNTRLFKREENYAVRFHETDIVTITPDNEFIYNSGGWFTMSTKERMNSYGPANIFSHRGRWFVTSANAENRWDHKGAILYFDGMIVNAQGIVLNAPREELQRDLISRQEKMDKRIVQFVEGYLGSLRDGMPVPGNGDCWYCLMFEAVKPATPRSRNQEYSDGERNRPPQEEQNNHLWEHIDESYFVPMLAVNALRDSGCPDMGIGLYLCMRQGSDTMGGHRFTHSEQRVVKRALLRYLRRRLLKGRVVR